MEPQSPGPLVSSVCLYTSLSSASEALGTQGPILARLPGFSVLATLLMIIKLSLNVYGKLLLVPFYLAYQTLHC